MKIKILTLVLLSFGAFSTANAIVTPHSEDSIDRDLTYSVENTEEQQRDVASDDQGDEGTRNLASEDELTPKIKYWKFE